jgi:hypothetical protein
MARVKRGTQAGDDAILRGVSGVEDLRNCGMHIATRLPQGEDTGIEERYTIPSVYDGTNLSELIAEERALTAKTQNEFISDYSFTRPLNGKVRVYSSKWAVVIKNEGGATYKIGGADLEFNAPMPTDAIEIEGDLMVERNGCVAGFALIGKNGSLVRTIKSSKRVWCSKIVPLGSAPKVIKL